ncbi:MAG TPA: AI-2E family transporter, partial [Anaerolineae bacterium]
LTGGLTGTLRQVLLSLGEATPKPIILAPGLTIDLGPFYAPLNQWLTATLQPEAAGAPAWPNLLFPFAGRAVSVVRGAVNSLVATIYILAVSFYVAKDAPSMGRFIVSRIPERWRPELDRLWRELVQIWDAYVRGQIILGVIMAIITGLVTTILGVHNSAALGLMAFFVEFVPGVGHVIAGIIAVLIAFAMGSTWLPLPHLWFALVIAIAYILMSQFENMYLLPRIIGHQISLHPVVVIIGALAGAAIGGVLGILLAAPTIASLRVLYGYGFHKLFDEDPFPVEATASPEHDLYWRGLLRDRRVAALLFDLDGTLVESDEQVVTDVAGRLAWLQRIFPTFRPERSARRLLLKLDAAANEITLLLTRWRLEGLLARFNALSHRLQAHHAPEDFVPVPGSLDQLHTLAQDYPLALITNRTSSDTAAFLTRFDLGQIFKVVVTRDDVGLLRPQPAALRLAARRLGVPLAYCVMIDDTPSDLRAAQAAGAVAVGVLSGFANAGDLKIADLVIPSMTDLCRWLQPDGDGAAR